MTKNDAPRGKKPKKKPIKEGDTPFIPGEAPPGYDEYLQEHRKQLRRLERELKGENMNSPWGEYD